MLCWAMSARIYVEKLSATVCNEGLRRAYAGLEISNFFIRQGISLGNNGNQVNFGVQLPHELDINRLQTTYHVRSSSLFI